MVELFKTNLAPDLLESVVKNAHIKDSSDLVNLTKQWEQKVKNFSDAYHKIRQQIPASVPAAPKPKDFSSALKAEFGKISLKQKIISKLPGKR